MKVNEIINEAILDPSGWGQTPYGTDIDYFGLRVQMKPSTFLELALPLGQAETNPEIEKHMQGGGKIAYPMLDIEIPNSWEEGDYSKPAKVVGHEGRNRMKAWIKLKGNDPIQVNIKPRGWYRRSHLTPDHIEAISKGLIGQRGNFVKGPLFATDSALEEDTVDEAEKRFGPSAGWTHVKDWKKQEIDEMRLQDFQVHDTPKLDAILAKCCELVLEKQAQDPDHWGMVGACLLDMDNRAVYGVNYATDDGKRVHAERAALENYTSKYGEPEPGCIIITTLSPCSEPMDERYGESCTDLISTLDIHKVYCGYQDATQDDSHKQFHVRVTRNPKLNLICKKFAETFLGEQP